MASTSDYLTLLACKNGHVITDCAEESAHGNDKFCGECGAETLSKCTDCGERFLGHLQGIMTVRTAEPANFCRRCGTPMPWTSRGLDAAREMADEFDGLDASERERLKGTIDDIVRDTPKTEVAATRYKKLMTKAGKEASNAMRSILIDIASETARRAIWGA